jgi:Glycerophosphoryl diester phosphodiesterase
MKKGILILLSILSMATFSFSQKVIITAHRGASGTAPENTLASFSRALQLGADFCELDAQETSDGVLIIHHDKNYKRTTGQDKNVWETPLSVVKQLDAGSFFNPQFKGEKIPLFSDVINLMKGKGKLNIELKTNGHEKKLAEKVVELVTQMDFIDDCIMTSFDVSLINKVKELNPKIKAGYIIGKLPDFDIFAANIDLISANQSLITKEFVEKAHKAGKEVHVWTVNEPEDMKKMIDLNVNSIITNYPEKVKEILDKK